MKISLLLASLVCSVALVSQLCAASAEEKQKPADKPTAKTAAKTAAKVSVAQMTLKGTLPETNEAAGLFGEIQTNLREVLQRISRAAKDDDIKAIILDIRSPTIGRGKLAELRAAIKRARESGKKVYARLESATTGDFLVATACDEIVMPESGMLIIPGVRAEVSFYKDLLDKIGLKADMMQVGDFKGAAEPLTRSGMSDAFRKQYSMLIDDLYEQMIDSIAEDRGLEKEKVKKLVDKGLLTPTEAKKAGLIDHVAYEDEFDAILKKELSADSIALERNYGKKKQDTDFSGMLGMIKLMEMMMGVKSGGISSSRKKVAIVYAVGAITSGSSGSSILGGNTMGSDTIIKALRKAKEDKTVVAIVLRVNSPGGSALASDLIWREIQTIDKPVIASMGDVAASGGYYISMGCDKILAEPGTLTGSIGVVSGKMVLGGLMDKVGINTEVISRGKNSGILSTDRPFNETERKAWKDTMQEVYDQFTTKAAKGRKMKVAAIEKLAAGRVWTGRQAAENGLVDRVGTLKDALDEAKKAGGLKEGERAELLILPKPKSFFEILLGDSAADAQIGRGVSRLSPELAKQAQTAALWRKLLGERVLTILPYEVRIR